MAPSPLFSPWEEVQGVTLGGGQDRLSGGSHEVLRSSIAFITGRSVGQLSRTEMIDFDFQSCLKGRRECRSRQYSSCGREERRECRATLFPGGTLRFRVESYSRTSRELPRKPTREFRSPANSDPRTMHT